MIQKTQYIITIVGISLIKHIESKNKVIDDTEIIKRFLKSVEGKDIVMAQNDSSIMELYNKTKSIARRFLSEMSDMDYKNISAEMTSLSKIIEHSSDKIHFFYTDTLDGELCASLLQEYWHKKLNYECEITKIKQLNVYSGIQFKKYGIKNLMEEIIKVVDNKNLKDERRFIINSTSGFKSIAPYLTIIAMTFGIDNKYIFERSGELLTIPPLPFRLDFDIIINNIEFLKFIDREIQIKSSDIRKYVPNEDIKNFIISSLLIEVEKQTYELSAFGLLLWENFKKKTGIVNITNELKKQLESSDKLTINIFENNVIKLFDPQFRNLSIHSWQNYDGDYIIAKTSGGNRLTRFVYYFDMQSNKLYIRYFFIDDHDEYERKTSKTLENKFDKKLFSDIYEINFE
ncbi:MAG: putative CRISPR-associated protein [Candidatus Wallbacteria bacterium]